MTIHPAPPIPHRPEGIWFRANGSHAAHAADEDTYSSALLQGEQDEGSTGGR